MVFMPNSENPYDEFMKQLTKMVEDILRNMPAEDTPRIIGCTIITGTSGVQPPFLQIGGSAISQEITYEMIEAEDRIFVTARIPSEIQTAAYADIGSDAVHIFANDQRVRIEMPVPIDVIHSYYQVRHGVIDIVLKKKPVTRGEVRAPPE